MESLSILKAIRQLIAAVTLLVWVGIHVHFAAEHCGRAVGSLVAQVISGEQPHSPCSHSCSEHRAPCDEEHRLDFASTKGTTSSKSTVLHLQAPQWLILCDKVFARRAALVLEEPKLHEQLGSVYPQPDKRTAGWLFVVQTALSVRGPSVLG